METWGLSDRSKSGGKPRSQGCAQSHCLVSGFTNCSLEAIYFIKRLKNSLKNQHVKISIRNRWALFKPQLVSKEWAR